MKDKQAFQPTVGPVASHLGNDSDKSKALNEIAFQEDAFYQTLELIDEVRQGSPHVFAPIERRFREKYKYAGELITTGELVDFAQEYHFYLTTGEPIRRAS